MDKRQENRYSMFQGVLRVLQKNQSKFQDIPLLLESYSVYQQKMKTLSQSYRQFKNALKGVYQNKKTLSKKLVDETRAMKSAIWLLRRMKKIERPLYKDRRPSQRYFQLMRDTELAEQAKFLAEDLFKHQEALKGFGITLQRINDYKELADGYMKAIQNAGSSFAEKIAARKQFCTTMDETAQFFNDDLDAMMEVVKHKYHDFYNTYLEVREIKDLGRRKKKIPEGEQTLVKFKKVRKKKNSS